MADREQLMLDTFVTLADTLATDYDVSEFLRVLLERCGQLLDITTGGVMLESPNGELQLAVALSGEMEALEQAEIDNRQGPCHEAYRTGVHVVVDDLRAEGPRDRWPTVTQQMDDMGLVGAYAFPLRLRDDTIGALNLYRDTPGEFREEDIRLAQAFADVAAIGILQQRLVIDAQHRTAQLQRALDSRILLEQAKGIVCAERNMTMHDAFELLRSYARKHNRSLREVASAVVENGSASVLLR